MKRGRLLGWILTLAMVVAAPQLAIAQDDGRPSSFRISSTGTVVDQVRFAMPLEYVDLVAALRPAQTLEEAEAVLRARNIPFRRSIVSIAGIAPGFQDTLRHAPPKDGFMFEDGGLGFCNNLVSADRRVERIQNLFYVEGLDPVVPSTPLGVDRKRHSRTVVLLDQTRFVTKRASVVIRKRLAKAVSIDAIAAILTSSMIPFSQGYTKVSISDVSMKRIESMPVAGVFAINSDGLLVVSKVVKP